MYVVKDDGLYFDDKRLSSRDALLADPGELKSLSEKDGVKHMVLPGRVDLVFAVGERVVGGESKRPLDLCSSTRSRRLARQLRTLASLVDVPCVLLKGGLPSFVNKNQDVLVNLVRIQALGFLLLPLPKQERFTLKWLEEYRSMLAVGSRNVLAAVSGSDNKLKRKDTLVSRVKGLGALRADRLMRLALEHVPDEELRSALGGKRMLERLREANGQKEDSDTGDE